MTIFRYSARAGTHDRGALFPFVLAGCLGLWALIAMAIASGPKLAAMDVESGGEAAYVSCQPGTARAASGGPVVSLHRELRPERWQRDLTVRFTVRLLGVVLAVAFLAATALPV
jgi:hypothetical protein